VARSLHYALRRSSEDIAETLLERMREHARQEVNRRDEQRLPEKAQVTPPVATVTSAAAIWNRFVAGVFSLSIPATTVS
jgi:hypothetical protein